MTLAPATERLLAERWQWFEDTARAPDARLRELLAEARTRGLDFPRAWREAVATVAYSCPDREEWLAMLSGPLDEEDPAKGTIRDGWARAYESEPQTAAEAALAEVADAGFLGGVPDVVEPEPEPRVCRECAGPLPERVKPTARFCSPRCKRAFNYRREQARAEAARSSTRPSAAVRSLSDGSRPTGGILAATPLATERQAA